MDEKTEVRCCGFCGKPVEKTLDAPEKIEYTCVPCEAIETIFKGEPGMGFWYAGWKRADGMKLRLSTSAEMMCGDYGWHVDFQALVDDEMAQL